MQSSNNSTSLSGKNPSIVFQKITDHEGDVAGRSQKLKTTLSDHDDALLLASFADRASQIAKSPPAKSVSPVTPSSMSLPKRSILLQCKFPALPSILNTQFLANSLQFASNRPRAISYSVNEITRQNAQPVIMQRAHDINAQVQAQAQVSLVLPKPRPVISQSKPCRTILRKKFSWKHYPPLESFLIANREEYLRHSTLNYTLQQKKYNNMLTEQMIQLASQHGLVFDRHEFSFVTVRDRIRCYYKSYVQSLKKRGIVCGYAARKAGLISKEEMNKNAAAKSKIYVPS